MTLTPRQFVIVLMLVMTFQSGTAQVVFKVQAGLGYLEHFSTGVTVRIAEKHNLSLLYGSNFFTRVKGFSTFMLQYDRLLNKVTFAGLTPKLGVKGGNTVYTSDYYKWKMYAIVPLAGVMYPLNNKIEITVEAGICINFEQSATRIRFGEIESYKEFLPDAKAGVLYRF
jgi:hypothetical protein